MKLRIRRPPVRHWKLMTATLAAFAVGGGVAIGQNYHITGIVMLLGAATMGVQWICIDPPGVDEADLH